MCPLGLLQSAQSAWKPDNARIYISGNKPIAHLGTPVVDLRLCALNAVEGVFELLDGAVQLFKGDPGFPDRFRPVKVLHRDISIGNIIIDVESSEDSPRGILIDWDVCRYEDGPTEPNSLGGQTVSCSSNSTA